MSNYELIDAVKTNNFQKVKTLVEKGDNVNLTDIYGKNSLHYAVIEGNGQILRYLIQNGGNINIGIKKIKLLHYAISIIIIVNMW
jgi:ankyrin repeat protein